MAGPRILHRIPDGRFSLLVAAAVLAIVPCLLADGPAAPAELPGPLVIVGGGTVPAEAREAFVTLAGKDQAKIIYVPTASVYADDPAEHEGMLKPWRSYKPASIQLLHTRDRSVADSHEFVKPLADASAVWFGGGDQSRITAAYKGTLFERELRKLHARGGVIGGTSAGAAVQSDPMITGGSDKAETGPGLGLLPGFVIDQHFAARNRQKRLAGVIAERPGLVGLGIDEGTAVIARGRTLRVVGISTVTVMLGAGGGEPEQSQIAKADSTLDTYELRRMAEKRAPKKPLRLATPGAQGPSR